MFQANLSQKPAVGFVSRCGPSVLGGKAALAIPRPDPQIRTSDIFCQATLKLSRVNNPEWVQEEERSTREHQEHEGTPRSMK